MLVKSCFFKKFWSLQNAMNICYCRQNLQLQSRVPCEKTWAMVKPVIKTFNLVVKQCVVNLKVLAFTNALETTLNISVKL